MIFSHDSEARTLTQNEAGDKARKLLELKEMGYPVPPFVIVTVSECRDLIGEDGTCDEEKLRAYGGLIRETYTNISSFAVRSASLVEDGQEHAHAGEFSTVLHVKPVGLEEAMQEVLSDAWKKLGRKKDAFSLMVQECIEGATYGGVLFTRNPLGGREMVIEYRRGEGVGVVHGQRVSREALYARESLTSRPPRRMDLPEYHVLVKYGDSIERHYDFPQDIEWIRTHDTFFILQTRPITSITRGEWEGITEGEKVYIHRPRRSLKKTTLAETFPRPRPLTFSFLTSLYNEEGPIHRAYETMGVRYRPMSDGFAVVGSELMVDMDAEIQSVFPALGYTRSKGGEYTWESWRGLMTTFRNMVQLQRLNPDARVYEELRQKLVESLTNTFPSEYGWQERFEYIREKYELIFRITLYSEAATKALEHRLGTHRASLPELLMLGSCSLPPFPLECDLGVLRGNSINFDDTSTPLFPFLNREHVGHTPVTQSSVPIPKWKMRALHTHREHACRFALLREYARLLAVRLRSYGEEGVLKEGEKLIPEHPELVWFLSEEELVQGHCPLETLRMRQHTYDAYMKVTVPRILAHFIPTMKEGDVGVSMGFAEGIVARRDGERDVSPPYILAVPTLTPDVPTSLNGAVGVIAREGGILSHAAIMAREMSIPVVVSPQMEGYIGKRVRIDGANGSITVLS